MRAYNLYKICTPLPWHCSPPPLFRFTRPVYTFLILLTPPPDELPGHVGQAVNDQTGVLHSSISWTCKVGLGPRWLDGVEATIYYIVRFTARVAVPQVIRPSGVLGLLCPHEQALFGVVYWGRSSTFRFEKPFLLFH